MKLLKVDTVNEARKKLAACCVMPETEMKELTDAAGHILAFDIFSKENIPPFSIKYFTASPFTFVVTSSHRNVPSTSEHINIPLNFPIFLPLTSYV